MDKSLIVLVLLFIYLFYLFICFSYLFIFLFLFLFLFIYLFFFYLFFFFELNKNNSGSIVSGVLKPWRFFVLFFTFCYVIHKYTFVRKHVFNEKKIYIYIKLHRNLYKLVSICMNSHKIMKWRNFHTFPALCILRALKTFELELMVNIMCYVTQI